MFDSNVWFSSNVGPAGFEYGPPRSILKHGHIKQVFQRPTHIKQFGHFFDFDFFYQQTS